MVAAVVSACVAITSLYFVLKSNNSLPKASVIFYASGATFFLLVGILIGRRSGLTPVSPSTTFEPAPQRQDVGNIKADGGNATASGGNVTQHLHFPVMPAILPATVPSPEGKIYPVDVEFAPWEGQRDKMYLTVTNKGPRQPFQAQCRILARRNDPNPPTLGIYDLQWQSGGMVLTLMPGQSGNLLIASADEDRAQDMEWITLEPAAGQQPIESHWVRGNKTHPEYDLEIKIIGQESNKPQSEYFTLRAGSSRALEMFRRSLKINKPHDNDEVGHRHLVEGSVGRLNASVQVWVHASGGRALLWYHQGKVTASGNAWSMNCWFGLENKNEGMFEIIAIADGNIESKNFEILPQTGIRSEIIRVRRTHYLFWLFPPSV